MAEASKSQIEKEYLKSYEAHNDAIFRFALFQTSSRTVALDITQDTFIKTWEYLADGNTVENMKALLYRIAHNLIIDYRRKKKTVSLDGMTESGFDVGFDPTEHSFSAADAKEAMKTLSMIDKKYKDVVVMRHIEGMSVKEIADITGESENTISVRIHRGLEKLRDMIPKKEY